MNLVERGFAVAVLVGSLTPFHSTDPTPAGNRPPTEQEKAYDLATAALDAQKWAAAADAYAEAVRLAGDKTDAALYWQAYALGKASRRADALGVLKDLTSRFPKSRWKKDARALEVELKGGAADAGEDDDDEIKVLALDSLMRQDPDRAITHLESLLSRPGGSKLKEKALFVLTQSSSERAQNLLVKIARGQLHGDQQRHAIEYLVMAGGPKNLALLDEIYASTPSRDVKVKILESFMIAGDGERILRAARNEKEPELRRAAINQLGALGATAELVQLYQTEKEREVKQTILDSLHVAGAVDKLSEVARTEANEDLRATAIERLGLFEKAQTEAVLLEIYRKDGGKRPRTAVLDALFVQGNARALIEIAKTEKDRPLRRSAVEKLSLMNSKEASEYLLKLLGE